MPGAAMCASSRTRIHRAVLLARGDEIGPDAIMLAAAEAAAPSRAAAAGAGAASPALVGRTVADVERDLILDTLQHCLGNRTHAANILGISIRTLRNKLQRLPAQGVRCRRPAGVAAARALACRAHLSSSCARPPA